MERTLEEAVLATEAGRPAPGEGPVSDMPAAKVKRAYPGSLVLSEDPMVAVIEDVLSPDEIAHIIDSASGRIRQAKVSFDDKYGVVPGRSGGNCWLRYDSDPVVRRIGERIAAIVGIPLSHAEALQVIHYGPEQEYRPHFDAYDLSTPKGRRCCRQGGQRLVTGLVYLNEVDDGGATTFPKLNLTVAARPGRLLIFHDVGEDINVPHPDSLHAGSPVRRGEKWAFNIWFHARPMTEVQEFNSLPSARPARTVPPRDSIALVVNRAERLWWQARDNLKDDAAADGVDCCFTYWDTYAGSEADLSSVDINTRLVKLIDRRVSNALAQTAGLAPSQRPGGKAIEFSARAYAMVWNGELRLYETGLAMTRGAQSEVRPGSQDRSFVENFPAIRDLVAQLRPVLSECIEASDRDRYLLLGIDTSLGADGTAQLVEISTFPNFIHSPEVNAEVNVPFFESVLRTVTGRQDPRFELL
ncbi:prolyl hydroxylase family protein [Mycolicibacterium sp. XJ1819]